jgi:two-component system, NarL family, nitrate/nitrite response regulator NarL
VSLSSLSEYSLAEEPSLPYNYGAVKRKLKCVRLILNKGNMRHNFAAIALNVAKSCFYWCVMISMIIADRCPVFLCGVISVLRSAQDFDVIASCCDGMKSLQAIRELSPDIALLDSSMPILTGAEVLATSVAEGSRTKILLLVAATERVSTLAASIGVYGVVRRDALPEVLVHDLQQVAAGRRLSIPASRSGAALTTTYTVERALAKLTKREHQIANLVSAGLSNKEIGQQLNLSAGTIKVHLHNIYEALEINNRTTLTALAISDRLNVPLRGHRQTASASGVSHD